MIGLFVLVVAVVGITRMAKTRGASPWLYGLAVVFGWLAIGTLLTVFLAALGFNRPSGGLTPGASLFAAAVAWGYVGAVAAYVRFRVGQ